MSSLDASIPVALAEVRRLCATGSGRQIRQHADLSLREVAREVGVAVSTLSTWERDLARPTGQAALRYHVLLLALASRTDGVGTAPAVRRQRRRHLATATQGAAA